MNTGLSESEREYGFLSALPAEFTSVLLSAMYVNAATRETAYVL